MQIGHLSLQRYMDRMTFPVAVHRDKSGIECIPEASRQDIEYLISLGEVYGVGSYSRVKVLYSTIDKDELTERIEKDRNIASSFEPPRDLLQKMVGGRKTTFTERVDVVRGGIARRFMITQHKGMKLGGG